MTFTSAILRTDYLCADSIFRINPKQQGGCSVSDNGCRGKVLLVYAISKLSDIGYRWDIYVNPRFTLTISILIPVSESVKILFDTYFVSHSLFLRFVF